jgi:hypothetical protein
LPARRGSCGQTSMPNSMKRDVRTILENNGTNLCQVVRALIASY